ncbi:transcriptional regulator GcvA [Stappia sp.]|uniref:transcriptional regulator GcvA n=1 Tax=Stappia sp. TaxID=1870903 RepID=UPI0032D99988
MRYTLPPLNAFRVFEAVARHMSFARAAEELHLTPSALSYQIKSLEAHLGQPLFKRMNRAIALTSAGRRLLPGVEDGLARFADAVAALTPEQDDRKLVVSTGPAFAAKVLVPRLHRFVDAWPDIELLVSANMKNVDFETDDADLGIRFGLGAYEGLTVEPLLDEAALALCTPEMARGLSAPEDLAKVTLLHDDSIRHLPDAPTWARWLEAVGVTGIDPTKGLRFSHADHALNAAAEGLGVVLGRRSLSEGDRRFGRLVSPFETVLPIRPRFFLVGPPRAFERRPVLVFRDWIRAEMAEMETSAR